MTNRRALLVVALFALHSSSCARSESTANDVPRVERPVAHVLSSGVGAIYLSIVNGIGNDVLKSVESPDAADAQLHELVMRGDLSTMSPASEGFFVAAQSTLVLEHGGKHIMLFGVRNPNTADHLQLRLNFERAGVVAISVPIQRGVELSRASQ